jgi:DNA-directed RNA polymerase subunit L
MKKNNEMKLIMENWRKFSDEADKTNKSPVLVETNLYKGSLKKLVESLETNSVSVSIYNKILSESIENDLAEIRDLISSKEFLTEAEEIEKSVGEPKGMGSKILEKFKGMAEKIINLAKTSWEKASGYIATAYQAAQKFSKTKLGKTIIDILKVAAFAAVAYIILHPSEAHAAINLPASGGRPPVTLSDKTEAGIKVINWLSTTGRQMLGEIADKLIELIKSDKVFDVKNMSKGVLDLLQEVRALVEKSEFLNQFAQSAEGFIRGGVQGAGDVATGAVDTALRGLPFQAKIKSTLGVGPVEFKDAVLAAMKSGANTPQSILNNVANTLGVKTSSDMGLLKAVEFIMKLKGA